MALSQGKPVVLDGGIGTTLYEQGILHTRAFEEANLTSAAKVRDGAVPAVSCNRIVLRSG